MSENNQRNMRDTVRRIAMSYELEDLLRRYRKQKAAPMTDDKTLGKLNEILSTTMESHKVNVNGNTATQSEFIEEEMNITTPNTIENCSAQILNGLHRLETDLGIFDSADAVIDIDSENEKQLNVDITVKEKKRIMARIGATHSMAAPVTGDMSVGIRNMFGRGESLEVSSNIGLSGRNLKQLSDIVHNTSNEYSIEFKKPRMDLPINLFPFDKNFINYNENGNDSNNNNNNNNNENDDKNEYINDYDRITKPYLNIKAFRESLDFSEASSYHRQSVGTTVGLTSPDMEHNLNFNYHFRSAVIDKRTDGAADSISPSVSDYQFPSVKSSVEYQFMRDTRDHVAVPTQGHQIQSKIEVAGLGADVDFFKIWGRFQKHWKIVNNIFDDCTFNFGFESGFVVPFRTNMLKLTTGDQYVRVIDRLIPMAGLQGRGFQFAQVGPKDGTDYVHCNFLLGIGASLTFSLFPNYFIYGNLFCNAIHCGLLKDTPVTDFGNARVSAGASLVIPTPVARIEVGYAHPIQTGGDPFSKFYCSFGTSFF